MEEADKFLAGDETIRARMNRVAKLIEGFEDAYGLELLSSVHWVMRKNPEAGEIPMPRSQLFTNGMRGSGGL